MNHVTQKEREALLAAAGRLRLELNEEGEVVGGFRETAAGLATAQDVSEPRARAAVSRVVRDLRRRQREERRTARAGKHGRRHANNGFCGAYHKRIDKPAIQA